VLSVCEGRLLIVDDMVPALDVPQPLFEARDREPRTSSWMGSIIPASVGLKPSWSTKFERRSPRYTTRINELPVVAAL
jgi:DNA polymerase V